MTARDRLGNLRSGLLTPDDEVFDDGDRDDMDGQEDQDWYLGDLDGLHSDDDKIQSDKKLSEEFDQISN